MGRNQEMSFCRKCGIKLKADALYCNKCGCKIETDLPIPDLSLKESLDLVETLLAKYTEIEDLESEVGDCEIKLSHPLVHGRTASGMFHYFWKFLLASGIAAVVCFFLWLANCISIYNTFPWPEVLNFFYSIIPLGIFIFGLIYSIRKSRADYDGLVEYTNQELQDRADLRKKYRELESRLADRKSELMKLDSNIPEEYRNAHSMTKMKYLLESGKASSLKSAITCLKIIFQQSLQH